MADEKTPATDAAAEDKPAAKKAPAKKSTTAKSTTAKSTTAKSSTASKTTAAKKTTTAKAAASKDEAAEAKAPAKKAPAKKATTTKAAAASTAKSTTAKAAASKKAEETEKVSTLKMHHLRPAEGSHTRKIRVGRGEASKGKTAGRGTKGTKARYQVPAGFEGGQTPIHMRIPKLPGFKNRNKITYQVVNVSQINDLFPSGGEISKADLADKGAVRRNQPVKVLGDGDISVKVTLVDADKVSQSAKTKIEAAGGSVN